MTQPKQFRAIKGTRDIRPPDSTLWNWFEQTAREVLGTYGLRDIRTPIFEETQLFARSIGTETDVVSKEMFTFQDPLAPEELVRKVIERGFDPTKVDASGEQGSKAIWDALSEFEWLTLRPEATASVCRAYIEHGMHSLPQPVKLYYMGPMFRRERPQKGRYRQFYQIGAEVLEALQPGQGGSKDIPKDAAVDAEVIEMVMEFFARLELRSVLLEINSIGDRNCRPKYIETLREALVQVKDRLGPDSQRRIETNPLRVLDSKVEAEQEIIAGLPHIADHLCADCAVHYGELKRQLDLRGVPYKENWRL